MPPKKKTGPPRGGARPAAGRGSGPAPGGGRPLAGNAAASDAGVDIVFSKAKPRAKGHKQRCVSPLCRACRYSSNLY